VEGGGGDFVPKKTIILLSGNPEQGGVGQEVRR
jgi:hypothetical protein